MNDVEHQTEEVSPPDNSGLEEKIRWTARVPRWVKVFVVTALGLALLIVVVMLVAGGRHGPGRHFSAAEFNAPVTQSAGATSFFTADDASAFSVR